MTFFAAYNCYCCGGFGAASKNYDVVSGFGGPFSNATISCRYGLVCYNAC